MVLGGENSLQNKKVNFIRLTSGTTFDLNPSGGWAQKVSLILRLPQWQLAHPKGANRLCHGGLANRAGKRSARVALLQEDPEISTGFQVTVPASYGLIDRIDDLCTESTRHRQIAGELRYASTS